jgi:transcriptional regulator with XRE-family HTH domain
MDHPIKRYRDRKGLTQGELAKLLGVSKATISRWEAGLRAPRRSDLPRISKMTGIELVELIAPAARA